MEELTEKEIIEILNNYEIEIYKAKNTDEINYYLNQSINKTLTVRQLREIIKNHEYDRLSNDAKNKLINKQETEFLTCYLILLQ